MIRRLRILGKLFHALWLHPELRIGQIVSTAINRHSAENASDIYYVDDASLLHVLTEFNKEAL